MNCAYILHEFAQQDYEVSLNWYLERSEQAAKGFIEEIENIFN